MQRRCSVHYVTLMWLTNVSYPVSNTPTTVTLTASEGSLDLDPLRQFVACRNARDGAMS